VEGLFFFSSAGIISIQILMLVSCEEKKENKLDLSLYSRNGKNDHWYIKIIYIKNDLIIID